MFKFTHNRNGIRALIFLMTAGTSFSGTPHLSYGNLLNENGSAPAAVTFTAKIIGRPADVLTQDSFGCGYENGIWSVQVGNFQNAWDAAELLHVDFNDGSGNTGSAELALTYNPADEFGSVVLSPNPLAKLLLPNMHADRGDQILLPVSLQGLGVPDSIVGYEITLSFDPTVLIALGADAQGTMTQNWGDPFAGPREESLTIAGLTSNQAGTQLIPDGGVLVNASFLVHGVPGNPYSYSTAVCFDEALLYVLNNNQVLEVYVSHLKTGSVTVDPGSNQTTRTVPLDPGWNLISLGIAPDPNAVPDVFGNLSITYAFGFRAVEGPMSWDVARPAFLNDLKFLDGIHGYWIKSGETNVQNWQVSGDEIPLATPIPMYSGWNLIGYLPLQADKIAHALAVIDPLFSYVSGFESGVPRVWDRQRPDFLNDLRNLKPLGGYWTKMDSARNLIYPGSGYSVAKRLASGSRGPGRHSQSDQDSVIVTPFWCDFWAHQPEFLMPGDSVFVRDPDGRLCGKAEIKPEGGFLVHVFGDDPNTADVDEGAVDGDTVQFLIQNSPVAVIGGNPIWTFRASQEVELAAQSTVVPDSFWCDFSGDTESTLTEGDSLTIFDPDGILCGKTVVNQDGRFDIRVFGDDPGTADIDEGAVNGDTMVFVVNGIRAEILSGNPVWASDSLRKVVLGLGQTQGAAQQHESMPESVTLFPNYPNPFNHSTTIRFTLPAEDFVDLSIFDASGKEVRFLLQTNRTAGDFTTMWDGLDNTGNVVSSGIYIIRLLTSDHRLTRKCLFIK